MFQRLRRQPFRFLSASCPILLGLTMTTTGCGAGGMSHLSTAPALSGNTAVTVQLSSTANDQLSQYSMSFNSIALTSQSGKTISLLPITAPSPPFSEFMHLNGLTEPLATVTVPQDVYTGATVTLSGSGGFTCVSLLPGSLQMSFFGPAQSATINVPSPITITGSAMALTLDLQVSQSATFSSCDLQGATYTNTPMFNLVPVVVSPQPTNAENGKQSGIEGLIASVATTGKGFSVAVGDGTQLSVNAGSSTAFQGVSGLSSLAAGMPIEMDTAIQSDGSLLATRVEVEDTDTTNMSVLSGPVLNVLDSGQVISLFGREQQGYLFPELVGGALYYSFNNATFQTSGQFANLQSLPFVPTFGGATMFAGQNVYASTHAATLFAPPPVYAPLATVTLVPQTINGTVTAVGSDGGFTTYTVALASYDLIPNLAVQPGQTTLLTDPGNVVVYVDGNTQRLNTSPLAAGSLLRFNGLLFNDNGTLRMDCGQVNDGVAE
jgi:hypothetical protein